MTKKTQSDSKTQSQGVGQQQFNELYTAHQVHTLAQMLIRQLAQQSWQGSAAWQGQTGGNAASFGAGPWGTPSTGSYRTVPTTVNGQPLLYWYP